MEPFNFKQFKVYQDFSAMRVNTDAVLLAAWVNCNFNCQELNVLDIGTGTGVISLMVAQRFNQLNKLVNITAVEIDSAACQDAEKNFKNAPWKGINFSLYNTSIQDFSQNTQQKYNLILSNPPFFISSLKSPDKNKTTARHADTLPQSNFINCTLNLIENGGRLALVLPIAEGKEFLRKIDFIKKHLLKMVAMP
jgi:Predicted O-methyltransferase